MAALPGGPMAAESVGARYELAGPETLTYAEIVELRAALAAPPPAAPADPDPDRRRARSKLVELLTGPTAFATWDEAELLEVPLISRHGTADAERLGVLPKPMARGARGGLSENRVGPSRSPKREGEREWHRQSRT